LTPVKAIVDEMLRSDLSAPRKQRHTIERIYQRLAIEHDFTDASYSAVRNYVARRRPEILVEARARHQHLQGMVPQIHAPGEEAEVDFCDAYAVIAGKPMKCYLFTLRLSFSGRAIHRLFASQGQEAFMEGHVEAFRALGGVPTRHIRYDNLKPAVRQVLFGRGRLESQRWVAFRSFYGFHAFYCIPGKEGAYEKGGVEHEGGRFRRNHLVPPPEACGVPILRRARDLGSVRWSRSDGVLELSVFKFRVAIPERVQAMLASRSWGETKGQARGSDEFSAPTGLLGAFVGVVAGLVLAAVFGVAGGLLLGPGVGWPVFWIALAATVLITATMGAYE
jgi:hypothetical protein